MGLVGAEYKLVQQEGSNVWRVVVNGEQHQCCPPQLLVLSAILDFLGYLVNGPIERALRSWRNFLLK
jgi:hypothetical protein